MEQMHIECHRDGTLWVWPFFSATDGKIHWEIIPRWLGDIIRSIETGVIIKIVTNEQLTVTVDDNKVVIVVCSPVKRLTGDKRNQEHQDAITPSPVHT